MKKYKVVLILFVVTFIYTYTVNAEKSTGFFRYMKLNNGYKQAIDNYTDGYKSDTLLIMKINPKDSLTITLMGSAGISDFIKNPSFYYSVHKGKLILIYTGIEKLYFPGPSDMALMFDFVSNYIDTSEFVKCDWKNYIFVTKLKIRSHKYDIYDQACYQYKVNLYTVLEKSMSYDPIIGGYPQMRFKPQFRSIEK